MGNILTWKEIARSYKSAIEGYKETVKLAQRRYTSIEAERNDLVDGVRAMLDEIPYDEDNTHTRHLRNLLCNESDIEQKRESESNAT